MRMSAHKRKIHVRTPSSGVVVHFERRAFPAPTCTGCGAVLHGASADRGISKTEKRPSRPFGGVYCSPCSRARIRASSRV